MKRTMSFIRRFFSVVVSTASGRIGVLYLITCALYAVLGLAAAVSMQLDMLSPTAQLTGTLWFGKLLTGHGMIMVFLVLLPFFPGVFGHLALPSAVGAPRSSLSRIGYFGWLSHVGAGALIVSSLLLNAYDAGWVMMMPVAGYSIPFVLLVLGLLLAELATLLPSIAALQTVFSRQSRTVAFSQLPLFAWFLLLGTIVQIVVAPVRLYTLTAVLGGHLWGWSSMSLLTPEGIALYQKSFWLFAGPATLGLILPAIGLLFEVVIAHTRAYIHRRTAVVASGIAILILALASWSQHLTATADGELSQLLGSFFGLLMILPANYLLLEFIRLLARLERPLSAAILFVISSIVCGLFAGVAGAALALPAMAIHLHNTYFTVAHLHLALAGVIGGAIFAGLFHFWPGWWQTSFSERMARTGALAMLTGLCLAFLPMALLGTQGLPRALYIYPTQFQILHTVSSIGTFVLAASLLLTLFTLMWSLVRRSKTKQNEIPSSGEFVYAPVSPETSGR
ncbi:MAG: cbb3-type cytochrome c oxidase subunit I [Candidatus Zixiibacteriota bacterium]